MDMDVDTNLPPPFPRPLPLNIPAPQPPVGPQQPVERINWVPPPSKHEIATGLYGTYGDYEGSWVTYEWKKDPEARIEPFYERWPPSRTSSRACAWISVSRGLSPAILECGREAYEERFHMDIDGLQKEFVELTARLDAEGSKLTPEMIDELAVKHGVLSGKWLVYAQPKDVDQLWKKIVRVVAFDRGYGSVKVSARKILETPEISPNLDTEWDGGTADPGTGHVICVYVVDYTDKTEVDALRKALRLRAGVFGKIGFKPDVYTWLGIYQGNKYKLRPSRYHDSDKKGGGSWFGKSKE